MNEQTRLLNPDLFGEPVARSAIHQLLGGDSKPKAERSNRRNDGRGFQAEIETTALAYQSRQIATIRKVDPPTRIVGGKEDRRIIFLKNPFLDFAGAWTARYGRALFFEAKSTATHKLKLGDGGLTDTQITSMRTWRNAGAATFVLWQWSGRVAAFTPEMILRLTRAGEKSLTFEDGLPVTRGVGSVIWDFLPVVEQALWPAQA